jgi:hypothetical protein
MHSRPLSNRFGDFFGLAIGLIAGYSALAPLTRQSSAFSPEAGVVRSNARAVTGIVEKSFALFGAKAEALNTLKTLAMECSESDWDGYGALPVNPATLERAETVLRSLPDDCPLPESSIEPDGEISFDWLPSRTCSFSVTIGNSDRIAYAWVDGTDRGHAVARAESGMMPTRILNELHRIYANEPTLRVA